MRAFRIDHKAIGVVVPEQAAHIADVVGEAGNDDMGIVIRGHVVVQRAAAQDVVSRQRDQHRVLDIVVERVAVSDAFKRQSRGARHDLHELRLRTEAAAHIGAEKLLQRICRQLR